MTPTQRDELLRILDRALSASFLCDPSCEGRCRICPKDEIEEARHLLTRESGQADELPEVGGRLMNRSHADFERACQHLLADEQEKILPDNALIAVLCDAVRLSRECCDIATAGIATQSTKEPQPQAVALKQIKALVCGEAMPNWENTPRTTGTRGKIADICDIALQSRPSSEREGFVSIPTEPDDGTLTAMWSAYHSAYEAPMSKVYLAIVACFAAQEGVTKP